MTTPVLELVGITKRFGNTLANDDLSFRLGEGEIVALLGENGAGKTTLMNILFGHYRPDRGQVLVKGLPLPLGQPRAAIKAGIGMVHQHFSLAPNLTVLDNVTTGTESLWSLRSRRDAGRVRLERLAQRFGLAVDPDASVASLSVGEQQRVEILKALYNDARILVLDEPTAVLTQIEANRLFSTLKAMAAEGLSLIFISHKLDEVMAAADRIVVLRNGRQVADRRAGQTSAADLAELMVGRPVVRPTRDASTPGPIVLEARNLGLRSGGIDRLKAVDFTLHAGEILGIVGVSGNGQTSLAGLLAGRLAPTTGDLVIAGAPVTAPDVRAILSYGVGRVPEDRNREGVVGDMAIWENVVLERLGSFSRYGFVDRPAAMSHAADIIHRFDVRGAMPTSRVRLLSGGNIQKLILGRNLITRPKILIVAQPTRGLDEGAVAAVHRQILEARRAGTAILLMSEDLDEVMALADRIQAIVGGRLSRPIAADEASTRRLGLMMSGLADGEGAHAI